MTKVPFAKHHDLIKAIPPDRSDKHLRTSVLPWRSWCDRTIPYAHRSETAEKDIAIDAIPVANNISRRLLPPVCLGQLPGNPFGARMRGYTQPQKLTAAVSQDQKPVQQPKRDRRDQEQVHRRDAVGMIAKEGPPALRRRPPSPRHVLCDYFATVICRTSMPSLSSAPCIRGAPQSGFATLISRMRRRMSAAVSGRPPRGRDFALMRFKL